MMVFFIPAKGGLTGFSVVFSFVCWDGLYTAEGWAHMVLVLTQLMCWL